MRGLVISTTLLCTVGMAHAGLPCDRFQVPPDSRVVVVAQEMRVNGVPVSASELTSKLLPAEVQRFYRDGWSGKSLKVVESDEAGWHMVGTKDGACFYTVQTKPGVERGTYALLSVTQLGVHSERARGEGFPKMGGSTVYNDIVHNDAGKGGARTLLLSNTFSPQANASFYRNALPGSGWVAISDQQVPTDAGVRQVQTWKRGLEEAQVVIAQASGVTSVVVNVVERP